MRAELHAAFQRSAGAHPRASEIVPRFAAVAFLPVSLSLSLSGGKKIYVKPEDRARTRLTGRGLRHSRANNFHGPGREMFCPRSLSRPTNRQRGVRIVGVAVDRASRRRVRDSGRSFPLASGKRLKRSSQASSRTRRRGQ